MEFCAHRTAHQPRRTRLVKVVALAYGKQRNAPNFDTFTLKLTPIDGAGCVFRLASEVLPADALTSIQAKVYAVLRDTFSADGATKSEWQRTCADTEVTFLETKNGRSRRIPLSPASHRHQGQSSG